MGIKYYKIWIESEQRYQYEQRSQNVSDNSMIEITQDEYVAETAKQWKEYIDSLPAEEENVTPTYEELLAENEALEAENAALLYQVLTGEEFADV